MTTRTDSITFSASRGGFSLIEMMIAIVILGLGLTMVATMFPVAWDRARQLSEYTTEVSVTAGVAVAVESTLRPGGMRDAGEWNSNARTCAGSDGVARIGTSHFAGDLIFDPTIYNNPDVGAVDLWQAILNVDNAIPPTQASDTRVHALHLENLLADAITAPPQTANEDPWKIEQIDITYVTNMTFPSTFYPRQLACGFEESSFLTPRFPVNMRVYPPLDALPDPSQQDPPTQLRRAKWLEQVERRRFAWGVLHRLRDPVGPAPDDFNDANLGILTPEKLAAKAAAGWGAARVFDMYYVTLRRPNPANRYARQDPDHAPDPYNLKKDPTPIQALPSEDDVLLPVAWRVQIKLPKSEDLNTSLVPAGDPRKPTGIPTSVLVPPTNSPLGMVDMMISMFPKSTRFVDEINGRVYRVVSTQLNADGSQAILNLDQEITLEDIDLVGLTNDGIPTGPPECPGCAAVTPVNVNADGEELLRTVWVYPPPVDRTQSPTETNVVFKGRTPVSTIDVRTVTLVPAQP